VSRDERNVAEPDLGTLSGRLLSAVESELFSRLHDLGFDDLKPRHGAVLAYLESAGIRATDVARRSGVHKQVIGTLIDELADLGYVERRNDPADRRAKLVCPTERGRAQMAAADEVMAQMQARHERRLGSDVYAEFKRVFIDVVDHQRRDADPER
jgi:DNA-binding MarR family transcriptional regulator